MCVVVLYLDTIFICMISFSRLHSLIEMCDNGIVIGCRINLVSLICLGVKYAFIMFL